MNFKRTSLLFSLLVCGTNVLFASQHQLGGKKKDYVFHSIQEKQTAEQYDHSDVLCFKRIRKIDK